MKTICRIVSIVFGVAGIILIAEEMVPMGMVLRAVVDPWFKMTMPTAGDVFLMSVRRIADAAAPMVACLLFWHVSDLVDRNTAPTYKRRGRDKRKAGGTLQN